MQYIKYKENKSHGTSEFPVGYYYVNHLHPQYTMPYHWHEELELIHIIDGEFEVTIDENSRLALPGDILIVNSGCLHGGIPHDYLRMHRFPLQPPVGQVLCFSLFGQNK